MRKFYNMAKNREVRTYYISEKREFYYEGLNLNRYDMHGNILDIVRINKFITHYNKKTKQPYFCVNVNDLIYKTKNMTYNVSYLGNILRKE